MFFSADLTSGIHSFLHAMGLRSSVTTVQTPPQILPGASMNVIYDGSLCISYMELVISVYASFSSCRRPSTDCLTAVDFYIFNNASSLPSTVFNSVNAPFYY